jgi:hypothetical protein
MVAVAVEHRGPGKPGKKPVPGFVALEAIPDTAAETLEKFFADKVKPRQPYSFRWLARLSSPDAEGL